MAQRKKITTKKVAQPTVKRSVASKSKGGGFWKVNFTISTVYWIIIGIAAISAALLSYNTNLQVNGIYDEIEQLKIQENL